jgi:hypothetical protein
MYNVFNRICLLDLEHYFFPLQNQPQLLVGNYRDILFIVRIFDNKLFFLKYVAAKYKEKHYHDPLNEGDGVEQPLSICFSKSCDKHLLWSITDRTCMVYLWIHFHELNHQKPI